MNKILVIDNDEDIRNSLYEILTTLEFQVVIAKNSSEGMIYALKELPDLIICDIMMDNYSGYDVLRQVKSNELTITIPFLFLSGKSTIPEIREGMELGADDYLTKPFEIKSLIKTINTLLNKKKQYQLIAEKKLSDLRYNISSSLPHEINTPLSGINVSAQLLKELKGQLTIDQLGELADIILTSSQRLSKLLNNFLLFSELELICHDEKELAQIRQKKVSSCLSEITIAIARKIAQEKQREKDLILDIEKALIFMPENRLQKVLTEIIENAFKYSQPEQAVIIKMKKSFNKVQLIITNEGKSLTPQQINSIGAYTQFDRNIHEQQGIGLGLIIAKKIMEIYQGNLAIKSIPNQETSIELTFLAVDNLP
ncbi:response regulator [Geminocystis sp. CENA526]|uniref:hybrid sensor histidine kinase/response regulator n=1 Tax=Geminocystis sp. CENA526 TaxID=1355871 RepID=UPI003D6EFF79